MEWAAQQWGRLIWWLKQNSEVIQAVSSAVTACIAGYLVGFNRRAVKAAENSYQAARDQFDISQKQFELTGKQFALALPTWPILVGTASRGIRMAEQHTIRNSSFLPNVSR
jgi:hypothetical protein